MLAQFVLFLAIGLMLFTLLPVQPVPPLASNDEIFPAFIVRSLPHGIAGLVIAAIFAAAMSNLSGSLNSLASTTVLDFYAPLTGRAVDDARAAAPVAVAHGRLGRRADRDRAARARLGIGVHGGLTIASIVYGPMLGAFLLGLLSARATETGVIAGIAVSLAAMLLVRLFTPLAWTWYVLVGTAVCVTVGYVASLRSSPRL